MLEHYGEKKAPKPIFFEKTGSGGYNINDARGMRTTKSSFY